MSMADDNFQQSSALHLLGLPFSTDMKSTDYTEYIVRSAAKKVGSPCQAIFYLFLLLFINLPFVRALNVVAITDKDKG